MNILETLWILIKTNSADVKKGEQETKLATDKLGQSLTATQKVSKDLSESFSEIASRLSEVILTFVSLDKTIESLKSAGEMSENLFFLSKQLGVNTQDIESWGNAVAKNGGTVQGFQSTLTGLTNSLNHFRNFGGGPLATTIIGRLRLPLNANTNAISLLRELANKFQNQSHSVNMELGQQIGLDPGTIMLLEQGNKEIDKLLLKQKELGLRTQQDDKIARQFADSWMDLSSAASYFSVQLDTLVLPYLKEFIDWVTKGVIWLTKHKDVAAGAAIGLGVGLVGALIVAIAAFGEFIVPLVIIGALLAGLPVLVGLLVAAYDHLKTRTKELSKEISDLWDKAKTKTENAFAPIIKFRDHVHALRDAFIKDLGQGILHTWDAITHAIMSAVNAIVKGINDIEGAYNKVKNFLHHDHETKVKANVITSAKTAVQTTSNIPLVRQSSLNPVLANKTMGITIGDITINTQATDAQAISVNFTQSLQSELRRALGNFDDGIQI